VRYQTAAELRADLKRLKRDLDPGVARASGTTGSAITVSLRRRLGGRWLWLAAFVALVLLIGGTLWFHFFRRDQPLVTPPKQTDAEAGAPLPPMQTMPFTSFPGRATSPAFSLDGDRIAFVWDGEAGDNVDIYVKVVGSGDPLRLTNHAGDNLAPAWSPDGRQIAFCRADWAANEFGIFVISALGPPEHKVFSLNRPISSLDWSADGKSLAFAYTDLQEKAFGVFLLSIEDRVVRRVTQPPPGSIDGTPVFSPDGLSLVFVRQGIDPHTASSIYRVRVAGGEPERLTLSDRGIKGLCWTADGREIVFSENASGERAQLWRMAASGGKALPVAGVGDNVVSPAISRRGHRLAYIKLLDDWNIWRLKISTSGERPAPTKLIYSTQAEDAPEYAPDGKHIAFASNRSGSYEIWVCDSDGRNLQAVTSLGGPSNGSPCWSPDGRRIAFDSLVQGRCGIYVVDADGGPARPITGKEEGAAFLPSWSKDGRWIFFASNRSGGSQIWQVPVQGGTPVQVTHQGGWIPRASQDGKFVYYFHWGEPKTGASIWRIPVDGGQETPVLTLPKRTEWNHWTLGARAIYYIDWEATPRAAIKCFSLETRKTTQLGEIVPERRLRGFGFQPGPRLGVSPDEQWLLYVQYDQSGSDIMLVENFR
jgi:Tol biopolymer transport system component